MKSREFFLSSEPGFFVRLATVAFSTALLINGVALAEGHQSGVKSLLEMRRENVIVQQYDLSCGAAALATLLQYQHGDTLDERTIATALIDRPEYLDNPKLVQLRQGFSLLDLKRFVDTRGYNGVGYGKLTLATLVKQAPLMVPINTHGYNHFVIFRGLQGNRVLLADPAWGNRTMTVRRFEQAWIDYPTIGKVGFAVKNPTLSTHSAGQLNPRASEFVTLR